MRLDPLRVAVAALALGLNITLAPLHGPPPDRARHTDAKSLRRRWTRRSVGRICSIRIHPFFSAHSTPRPLDQSDRAKHHHRLSGATRPAAGGLRAAIGPTPS